MRNKKFECSEAERINDILELADSKRDEAQRILDDLEAAQAAKDQAAEEMLSLAPQAIERFLKAKAQFDKLQSIVDALLRATDLLDANISDIPNEVFNGVLEQHRATLSTLFERGFSKRIAAIEQLLEPARKGFGDYVSKLLQAGKPIHEAQRLSITEPVGQYPEIIKGSISSANSVVHSIKNRFEKPGRKHLNMLKADLPAMPKKPEPPKPAEGQETE